jgi:transcriptional regulator with XRE-family HTH domain
VVFIASLLCDNYCKIKIAFVRMKQYNYKEVFMSLGKNIQYLRKQKKVTQEQLAEYMSVSRQTISKWEADEIVPELCKLVALSDMFSCKLDALVREDLNAYDKIYSEVTIKTVKPFRMARYVMVTPKPEDDVNRYMDDWAQQSGLLEIQPDAKKIGWDFPYVSAELQNRFGLRGYVAAYILPDGFEPCGQGVELANQAEADYAVITVYDPFAAAFERIPNAYKKIMEYLQANGLREKPKDDVLSCFEYVYEKNGITCMDVYVHVDSVLKTDAFNSFS